jgi:hypothetical protein
MRFTVFPEIEDPATGGKSGAGLNRKHLFDNAEYERADEVPQ